MIDSVKRQNRTMTHLLIVAVVIITVVQIGCGVPSERGATENMKQYLPLEIEGWHLRDSIQTYDRESIFDYINGAGEVYRSYDFRRLSVFHYDADQQPGIMVEMFDMGRDEDAYGIFSHARESEESGIGQGYEYSGGRLCFWQARMFVCVLAESETDQTKEAVYALSRQIAERISPSHDGSDSNKPHLIEYLPKDNLRAGSIRFFHQHASLNYHYYLAVENILQLNDETNAVLGCYDPAQTYLLCVEYINSQAASNAYASFIQSYAPEAEKTGASCLDKDKWIAVRQQEQYLVVVFDASTEKGATGLVTSCVEKITDRLK